MDDLWTEFNVTGPQLCNLCGTEPVRWLQPLDEQTKTNGEPLLMCDACATKWRAHLNNELFDIMSDYFFHTPKVQKIIKSYPLEDVHGRAPQEYFRDYIEECVHQALGGFRAGAKGEVRPA